MDCGSDKVEWPLDIGGTILEDRISLDPASSALDIFAVLSGG